MDNSEKLATLGTQDTGGRQKKHKKNKNKTHTHCYAQTNTNKVK